MTGNAPSFSWTDYLKPASDADRLCDACCLRPVDPTRRKAQDVLAYCAKCAVDEDVAGMQLASPDSWSDYGDENDGAKEHDRKDRTSELMCPDSPLPVDDDDVSDAVKESRTERHWRKKLEDFDEAHPHLYVASWGELAVQLDRAYIYARHQRALLSRRYPEQYKLSRRVLRRAQTFEQARRSVSAVVKLDKELLKK